MPDMSGLLFLQELGAELGAGFPVTMMTADASVATARKAFNQAWRK